MNTYTNKNRFFGEIIDTHLQDRYVKDLSDKTSNLCDIDYVYRFNYKKCNVVSQLEKTGIVGNKWLQYKSFVNWCKKNNKLVPDYIPETYLIKKDELDSDFLRSLFVEKKKWIVKPENASFRAGIKVVNEYDKLMSWINSYNNNKWIIQDYIDHPLKLENKKIHFRIYVLLVKTRKYADVYIYNKGYIFTSLKPYDINSLDDDSNLSGGDSWEQMRLYPNTFVKEYGLEKYKFILPQINTIVKDTMLCCMDNLQCINKKVDNYKCYKLLGYDILINEDFKLFLGEINSRTVNVKFPIKNMYNNILDIVTSKNRVTNEYLYTNNINFYSVINKTYKSAKFSEEEQTQEHNQDKELEIVGGGDCLDLLKKNPLHLILISVFIVILFLMFKNFLKRN